MVLSDPCEKVTGPPKGVSTHGLRTIVLSPTVVLLSKLESEFNTYLKDKDRFLGARRELRGTVCPLDKISPEYEAMPSRYRVSQKKIQPDHDEVCLKSQFLRGCRGKISRSKLA